jgi:hypothetical protein
MNVALLNRYRRMVELQRRARNVTARQAGKVWYHVPLANRILFAIVAILVLLALWLYLMGMFFVIRY